MSEDAKRLIDLIGASNNTALPSAGTPRCFLSRILYPNHPNRSVTTHSANPVSVIPSVSFVTNPTTIMLIRPLSTLILLASFVFADVEFTSPTSGATLPAGKTLSVQWKDSGDDPPLKTFTTYQLLLCAGGNDQDSYIQVASIAQNALFSSGNSASGTIQSGIGGPYKNA